MPTQLSYLFTKENMNVYVEIYIISWLLISFGLFQLGPPKTTWHYVKHVISACVLSTMTTLLSVGVYFIMEILVKLL